MRTSVITAISTNYMGVSLADAKDQLRILSSDTSQNTQITRLIKSATQWMERRYQISILTQTRTQKQESFYDREYGRCVTRIQSYVPILYPPIQDVTEVMYTKEDGTTATLTSGTDFGKAGLMAPFVGSQDIAQGKIYPINSWPSTKWIPEAVQIKSVNGFGADDTFVPNCIKEAILRCVSFMYENRTDEMMGSGLTGAKFEMGIDRLMSTFENWQHVMAD